MPTTNQIVDDRYVKLGKLESYLKAQFKEGGYRVRVGQGETFDDMS
jgi:hypothetical protein